ncbi:MAG: hypothetical protein PHW53_00120 [Patescibacteria group bacterium]|nr:hypothetical protein [Patescibacteria group bacterium]
MLVTRTTYLITIAILIVLEAVFQLLWPSPLFGLLIFAAGLGLIGLVIGARLLPNWRRAEQVLWGAMFVFSMIAIAVAIFYYFWSMNPLALSLAWLPPAVAGFFSLPTPIMINDEEKKNSILVKILLAALFIIITAIVLKTADLLWDSGTLEAIRSPWTVVPKNFFILFYLATAAALIFLAKSKSTKFAWLTAGALTFLFLGINLFIYKIGYGFDPFIHQATEKYLAEHGTITPKPFYYIGQYSWVVFLNYFTHLGINLLDKLLLPILAAAALPAAVYTGLRRGFGLAESKSRLAALLILLIPLSSMIATTPQGLANLFTLIIIFLSLAHLRSKTPPLILLVVLAAATVFIHPLSGIPTAIYLTLIVIIKIKKSKIRIPLVAAAAGLGAIALPLLFILNSLLSGTAVEATTAILQSPAVLFSNLQLPAFYTASHFSSILDFIYIYGYNLAWIIPLLAILAIIFIARKKIPYWWLALVMFAILLVNYFFLQNAVEFSFLISYERGAYAERVLALAQFFLYPFFILGVIAWVGRAWRGPWAVRAVIILFLAACLSASLYLSYPRQDALEISKGINVSKSDLAAVQWVERDAPNDEFIALANQTVAAAALHEFGFKKYFGDKFYYPIPTGGELYQYYLKMSYESPSAVTMRQAMDLVGVNYGYFIINDYWWNSEKIIEDAKLQAGSWQEIDEGKIYIFKYKK